MPVEAQACGTPVLAYGKGGALETILDQQTGLFFDRQQVDSLLDCIRRFEKTADAFDPHLINQHAQRFSNENFKSEFEHFLQRTIEEWR